MEPLTELARAKVNLTLHVGRVRKDGYHPLESLVVFADIADVMTMTVGFMTNLKISGPFAEGLPTGKNNLIMQAIKQMKLPALRVRLIKNLPISAGIGGGSADAAATLRLIERICGQLDRVDEIALGLGADVPVCLQSQTCLMAGIGEDIALLPTQKRIPAILVNSGVAVSTADVFNAFDAAGAGDAPLGHRADGGGDLLYMAKAGRNDLQRFACAIAPEIFEVLALIGAQEGVQLARMSGSGATCFGLFSDYDDACVAAARIKGAHPDWWSVPVWLGGQQA